MIRSPLRYPGGKSRGIKSLIRFIPPAFSEYREPFIGGGSFFVYLRQLYPDLRMWINDLNPELFCFWKCAQEDAVKLMREILKLKLERVDGRGLFYELLQMETSKMSQFERAVRFFVLNRITFSGVVEAGGYSEGAFIGRFTKSSIERIAPLGEILDGVEITNLDYKSLLMDGDGRVFTFLDPPYRSAKKLYGKHGRLHEVFDHVEFSERMRECRHRWLITYDDSPEIRESFRFANLYCWKLQYGMNNYKRGKAEKGSELFISSHPLPMGEQAGGADDPIQRAF